MHPTPCRGGRGAALQWPFDFPIGSFPMLGILRKPFFTYLWTRTRTMGLFHLFSHIKRWFSMPAKARNLNGLAGLELTDAVFHNLAANHRVPGLAVSLMDHGEKVLHKGYGMADMAGQVPMDPDHSLLRIASISKCITALALGRMMEEGLLALDADFREYVPEYPQR